MKIVIFKKKVTISLFTHQPIFNYLVYEDVKKDKLIAEYKYWKEVRAVIKGLSYKRKDIEIENRTHLPLDTYKSGAKIPKRK